ncbi:MAG: leucine-rich repeat protein [Eubacterium sp.]|nr:leucine-rich repeat protein [Eubacterium sp.]
MRVKKRLMSILMAIAMVISVVASGIGMKQVKAATPMKVSIQVPCPTVGRTPEKPIPIGKYSVLETSGPSGCVQIAYYTDSIFNNGVYWTDDSDNKLTPSAIFKSKETYILHLLLKMDDTTSVSGSFSLSNDVNDYKVFWRGREAKDIWDLYPLYKILSVNNYKNKYKEVVIEMDSRSGWNSMTIDMEEPSAGEQVIKNISWGTNISMKPKHAFVDNAVYDIDISDTWYESSDGENYSLMSPNDKYVKGRYYKTAAPKKIMNFLVEHFYDKNYCPLYNTMNVGYGENVITEIPYGLAPEFTFQIHGNQFSGFDPNGWNKTGVMQNGEYIFAPAREKIKDIKIKNLDFPVSGYTPDMRANVDGSGYSINNLSASTSNNVEWFDKSAGNIKLSDSDKFQAGHTYIAHYSVTAEKTFYFNGEYKDAAYVNGYKQGNVLGSSSEKKREVEIEVVCPKISLDEVINISNVKPILLYDEYSGGSFNQSTWEWKVQGKYSDKYYLYDTADYYQIKEDGTEEKLTNDGQIVAGHKYQMHIRLVSADNSNLFPTSQEQCEKIKVTVQGAEKTSVRAYQANSMMIIAEFTAKKRINQVTISGKFHPVVGKTNAYTGFKVSDTARYKIQTMNSDYFKNGILWGEVAENGSYKDIKVNKPITIEKGKKYYARILIQAKEGDEFFNDKKKITAKVGGVVAKVEESEGGKNCIVVTIEAEAKEAITKLDYIIPEPKAGEKPGYISINTVPANALSGSNKFDSSSMWQVSSDGKTFEGMSKDAKFEAGKYYRTNAPSAYGLILLAAELFGSPFNNDVTYGFADNYETCVNGKSINDDGVLIDGYVVFGPLPETKKGDGETPGGKDTTTPGGKTTPGEDAGKTISGVGTFSKDGKTLTDTDGVKYKVSDSVTQPQLKKNAKIADKKSGGKYRITKITKKGNKIVGGTVEYMAPYNKNAKLISATEKVKLGGVTFTVTSIAPNCAKGCKKLAKVVIGRNVANIGKNAFNGCAKLKTITIKSKKLKKVGANALKGINKKAVISVPKTKKKAYTKILKGKGQAKTVKIK